MSRFSASTLTDIAEQHQCRHLVRAQSRQTRLPMLHTWLFHKYSFLHGFHAARLPHTHALRRLRLKRDDNRIRGPIPGAASAPNSSTRPHCDPVKSKLRYSRSAKRYMENSYDAHRLPDCKTVAQGKRRKRPACQTAKRLGGRELPDGAHVNSSIYSIFRHSITQEQTDK
jgi:hypothetical protein